MAAGECPKTPHASHQARVPGSLNVPQNLRFDASADPLDEAARHADQLGACPCAGARPLSATGPPARPNRPAVPQLKRQGHPVSGTAGSHKQGRGVEHEESPEPHVGHEASFIVEADFQRLEGSS
jgi:hypothetical protein